MRGEGYGTRAYKAQHLRGLGEKQLLVLVLYPIIIAGSEPVWARGVQGTKRSTSYDAGRMGVYGLTACQLRFKIGRGPGPPC